ncbi:MAG: hypothetical protein KBA81_02975 [Rhabdochlamydiaceae bacterium]|jgi:antitoxin component of RelBE/YafQ-DinJ toxin-antitoxin module|nr:hypothetical protein [Rhabdochlamydiaceae bacterium]
MSTQSGSKTTRMSIDVGLKDHKRIKMLAAAEGVSIREFVIECITEKIYPEKIKHPNKTTRKAMENARKGKAIKAKDFDEICRKIGL